MLKELIEKSALIFSVFCTFVLFTAIGCLFAPFFPFAFGWYCAKRIWGDKK